MIRKPNLSEKMLFGVENELSHLESLAKLMSDSEEREFLDSSIERIRNTVALIQENVDDCERAGITQSQRESLVAEHDYLEVG